MPPRHRRSTLFPYTTLFRSDLPDHDDIRVLSQDGAERAREVERDLALHLDLLDPGLPVLDRVFHRHDRSEEHTSELQSHSDLVCRLLLEKKKPMQQATPSLR